MTHSLSYSARHVEPKERIPERTIAYRSALREIGKMRSGRYDSHEHAIRLASDPSMLAETRQVAERYFTTSLRYVVVVGIGGSNLGTQAIYDALRRERDGIHADHPRMVFLDTISSRAMADLFRVLDEEVRYKEEILVNLISKSGGTTESISNFELLFQYLEGRFGDARERVVVTTDHGSPLWRLAEKRRIGLLPIPDAIGGRFSVFTPVGLFPLSMVGIDVAEMLKGAKSFLDHDFDGSGHAARFAEHLFQTHRSGVSILNAFFFDPELESLGKWMRQLYGESVGKEKGRSGRVVREGITPIVSIGSTDLHSMAQLYFGGPKDKFTLFVRAGSASARKVPKGVFSELVPGIEGKTPEGIIDAIYKGVLSAYDAHELPYGEAILPELSPYSLGMFLEWQMISVMLLADMLDVNAFDQPNVEDYKKTTRTLLSFNAHGHE